MPRAVPTHKRPSVGTDRRDRSLLLRQAWRGPNGLRRLKLSIDPCCERCLAEGKIVQATVAHHKIERRVQPALALDLDNLESLCAPCHSRHHRTTPRTIE